MVLPTNWLKPSLERGEQLRPNWLKHIPFKVNKELESFGSSGFPSGTILLVDNITFGSVALIVML